MNAEQLMLLTSSEMQCNSCTLRLHLAQSAVWHLDVCESQIVKFVVVLIQTIFIMHNQLQITIGV